MIRVSTRSIPLPALALAMLLAHPSWAQKDKSLTKDFSELSPKERSRIAAKETEEAKKDTSYQQVMVEAEQAFQEKQYEGAIVLFERARAMRPYNVYPKVKIEDLRALIAKRDAAAAALKDSIAAEPPPPAPVVEQRPAQVTPVVVPPPITEPAKPAENLEASSAPAFKGPEPKVESVRTEPAFEPAQPREIKPVPKNAPKPPDGVTERTYKEANAVVIERTVTEDGHAIVYKRVFHNWGRAYYFQDGMPIAERVWKDRFGEP